MLNREDRLRKNLKELDKKIDAQIERKKQIESKFTFYVELKDSITHEVQIRSFNSSRQAIAYILNEIEESHYTVESTLKYIYKGD